MKIIKIEFINFRSFGPQNAEIEFDPRMNFFIGKNHTGKSNLITYLSTQNIS
jgi:recombinational DNA repair ATPase RecF